MVRRGRTLQLNMSFDVFLQRFKDGDSAEADRMPVREVLSETAFRGPDEFGFYVVAFPGGGDVEFSAKGLESQEPFTDCAFHIRGFSDGLMKFIFDVARAGDMVILPAMKGNPLVMVSESQAREIPSDLRDGFRPIVVRSGQELAAVLSGGFEGWAAYRDQILRRPIAERET